MVEPGLKVSEKTVADWIPLASLILRIFETNIKARVAHIFRSCEKKSYVWHIHSITVRFQKEIGDRQLNIDKNFVRHSIMHPQPKNTAFSTRSLRP